MVTTPLGRLIGDELRAARNRLNWTRREMLDYLPSGISEPTLGTYEQGSRSLSVVRMVELCWVLEVSAPDLLARSIQRATGVHVDLRTLARGLHPDLSPLRRWAGARLRALPPATSTIIFLGVPAIARMAELCGIPTPDLVSALLNGNEK